ncbi:MAG: hypothetical protein WAV05_09340 [Anaerolineales bacterium]
MYNGNDIYRETAKGGIQVSVQGKVDSAIGADRDSGTAFSACHVGSTPGIPVTIKPVTNKKTSGNYSRLPPEEQYYGT